MKSSLRDIYVSMIFPTIITITITAVYFIDVWFDLSLTEYGLRPFTFSGLIGIITSPFLHADAEHLSSNVFPLFLLTSGLFYFYKTSGFKILLFCYLVTGFWTWFLGRGTGIHIGASGVVNALILFHIVSSLLRRRKELTAFSFLIIMFYGGFIWGLFPELFPDKMISWQSHLSGIAAGTVAAFYFRNIGPQPQVWQWDDDDEDDDEDEENEGDEKNGDAPNDNSGANAGKGGAYWNTDHTAGTNNWTTTST